MLEYEYIIPVSTLSLVCVLVTRIYIHPWTSPAFAGLTPTGYSFFSFSLAVLNRRQLYHANVYSTRWFRTCDLWVHHIQAALDNYCGVYLGDLYVFAYIGCIYVSMLISDSDISPMDASHHVPCSTLRELLLPFFGINCAVLLQACLGAVFAIHAFYTLHGTLCNTFNNMIL